MPTGPGEATRSTGAGTLQTLRWAVTPQILPEVIAFWLYRFEINIRASAILGILGAGGVGSLLAQVFERRDWERIGITLTVIIVVTVIVDQISGAVRHRVISGVPVAGAKALVEGYRDSRRRCVTFCCTPCRTVSSPFGVGREHLVRLRHVTQSAHDHAREPGSAGLVARCRTQLWLGAQGAPDDGTARCRSRRHRG
ncbi:MAG: PhnE/PtxC family ABC transporter permease [Microcella pacifica]